MSLVEEIAEKCKHLTPERQRAVLEFAEYLVEKERAKTAEPPKHNQEAYLEVINTLNQTVIDFKEDGLEMNPKSVEIATEILKTLAPYPSLLKTVSISADPDGKTVLRWKSKTSGVFSMSIGTNRVLYYASTLQGEDTHGREYFNDEIPSTILEILMKIQ
jgi:hypothetical protein